MGLAKLGIAFPNLKDFPLLPVGVTNERATVGYGSEYPVMMPDNQVTVPFDPPFCLSEQTLRLVGRLVALSGVGLGDDDDDACFLFLR